MTLGSVRFGSARFGSARSAPKCHAKKHGWSLAGLPFQQPWSLAGSTMTQTPPNNDSTMTVSVAQYWEREVFQTLTAPGFFVCQNWCDQSLGTMTLGSVRGLYRIGRMQGEERLSRIPPRGHPQCPMHRALPAGHMRPQSQRWSLSRPRADLSRDRWIQTPGC